jgi:hypothetical protein
MTAQILTQQRLQEMLHYDTFTGDFTWNVTTKRRKAGDKAGTIDNNGYQKISVDKKLYYAHRLAWLYVNGEFPSQIIDHINGNPSDNRIENLRNVSSSENAQNRSKASTRNATGFLGVFKKPSGRYSFQISVKGKFHRGKEFDTAEEAYEAYFHKKRELHTTCTI